MSPAVEVPLTWKAEVSAARAAIAAWKSQGIHTIGYFDENFPRAFRTMFDPPALVWVRGRLAALDSRSVAIVGTRHPTPHGEDVATRVARAAVENRWTVISGLARGIDTVAHTTTMESGGHTIAVLPSAVDVIYPAVNESVAIAIRDGGGALLSELPPGRKPQGNSFVDRDRLQSALSRAVFVCQTGRSGGTMHTTRFAAEQGRHIYCPVLPAKMSEADEGIKLLLRSPGKDLPHLTPEWAKGHWNRGQLTNRPVAAEFTIHSLDGIFKSLGADPAGLSLADQSDDP
jgi:DNA protecting protein DprA